MSTTPPSARSSRKAQKPEQRVLFQAPADLTEPPQPEVSATAREEFRRILVATGRQKGVGIHVFGVSSGETRISAAIADTVRGEAGHASLDIDDVIDGLEFLRDEIKSEKPVEEFVRWFCERLGYEARKVEPLSIEERLEMLERQDADERRLLDLLLRNRQRRTAATEKLRGDMERDKDGVR